MLEEVGSLERDAQISFEGALDGFYDTVYPSSNNRLRRRLQVQGVVDVTTNTFFKDQKPSNTSNTIVYNQVVTYKLFDPSVTTSSILVQPFDVPDLNQQLRERLRVSHPAFENLADTPITAPLIPETPEEVESDSGMGTGIIVGVAVAGAAVVSLLVLLLARSSLRGREGKEELQEVVTEHRLEPAESVDTDDDGPPLVVKSQTESTKDGKPISPDGISFRYSDRSVSTVDYDYSKAYGGAGDNSIVSSASATLGDGTRQSAPDGLLGSASIGSAQVDEPVIREEIFEVNAPSGKLGGTPY